MRRTLLVLSAFFLLSQAAMPHAVLSQDTLLKVGEIQTGTLKTGQPAKYVFQADERYFVRGHVDQISVDVVVKIMTPGGDLIAEIDGPAVGPERFRFETKESGTFSIEVSPFENNEGNYTIELTQLEPVATDPGKRVDQLLVAFSGENVPGAEVAVWRDGKTLFRKAYGMANLTYAIPFSVDTPTNIGSTSKQFTAFAIMLLSDEEKLSLDDDVREHIPELPDLGETVTIRNLLTHTSGYREFLNLLIMAGWKLDHADWIDRSQLIEIVSRQPALQNSPGTEFNYNNTGFALLAEIVERISGQDFPTFMAENVFGPLGMDHTVVRKDPETIILNRSVGYIATDDGGYRVAPDLGGAYGAGGIYTTLSDLQTWVENMASPRVGTKDIFDQMMTPYTLKNGESTGYGFGLTIDKQRGLNRIQHGGADVAHRSMLAYYPEINAGVTAQSNNASFQSSIAFLVAQAFFEDAMDPESPDSLAGVTDFDPDSYDPESFDELAGRYALDEAPSFILTFTSEDSTFFTQATGQPKLQIVPTSDSTFTLVAVEASVTFQRNADGDFDALTLHQNGEHRATRIKEDEGEDEEWEPVLDDYSGRYFSDEIETMYTVSVEDSALVAKLYGSEAVTLTPGEEADTFTVSGITAVFERDKNGQIIGLYLSNGRTRNVRFRRVF